MRLWSIITIIIVGFLLCSNPCIASDSVSPENAPVKVVESGQQVVSMGQNITSLILDFLFKILSDPTFLTILIIFVSAIFGAFLKGRAIDLCVKDFRDYLVHVETTDKRDIYGNLWVGNTGMELRFRETVKSGGFPKTSFVLYKGEYGLIQAVIRYVDEQSGALRNKRRKQVIKTSKPGLIGKTKRKCRSFINTVKDSLSEVSSLLMSKAGKVKSMDRVMKEKTSVERMRKSTLDSITPTSYDKLLETLIGLPVIVEIKKGDETLEMLGYFREYTSEFLEILDVEYPFEVIYAMNDAEVGPLEKDMHVDIDGRNITVTNGTQYTVDLIEVDLGPDGKLTPNVKLSPGQKWEQQSVPPPEDSDDPISPITIWALHLKILRTCDLLIPRSKGIVRHRTTEVPQGMLAFLPKIPRLR